MVKPRKLIGQILVESGIITEKTLARALERQRTVKKRLGMILDEMGVITEEELADALARQFGFQTVKGLVNHSFPEELLRLVPRAMAQSKLVFPLRKKGDQLAVAITGPDTETLDILAEDTGLQIVPVFTTRQEIQAVIDKHYPSDGSAADQRVKILVVDDTPTVASLIEETLVAEGYHVVVAHDGLQGLRLAIDEKPSLIICDCVMPRMDGYGLKSTMKAVPAIAEIPIILLTSQSSREDEQKALNSGFLDFVPKPVDPVRLVSRVKRALELMKKFRK
jgi:CheY-like chemotaxis protein